MRESGYGARDTGNGAKGKVPSARPVKKNCLLPYANCLKTGVRCQGGTRGTGHGQDAGALEKERNPGNTVLFPICLDDAVMETDHAWAASLLV
jgi:hypothetical protein